MRKDFIDRKGVNGVYVYCEVTGLNLDALINRLKREGLTLYDIKKTSNKRLIIKVKLREYKKFFAIADKMCYNVKKIRYAGWGYPLYFLFSSFGLVVGALVFLVGAVLANDFIFSLDFVGSGSVNERETRRILKNYGVIEYARFSSLDLKVIEDKVLSDSDMLSFVSLVKSGNRLIVNSALTTEKVEVSSGKQENLYSTLSGEVEDIKVYRGEAVVSRGDFVKKGDLLVKGEVNIKENQVKTGVLATVTLLTEQQYFYRSPSEFDEAAAEAFALAESGEECVSSFVEKTQDEKGFLYTVTLKYRRIIYAG